MATNFFRSAKKKVDQPEIWWVEPGLKRLVTIFFGVTATQIPAAWLIVMSFEGSPWTTQFLPYILEQMSTKTTLIINCGIPIRAVFIPRKNIK